MTEFKRDGVEEDLRLGGGHSSSTSSTTGGGLNHVGLTNFLLIGTKELGEEEGGWDKHVPPDPLTKPT